MRSPKTPRSSLEFSVRDPWLGEERKPMKAARFTESQKAFIIKQAKVGTPVLKVCR